MTTPEPLHIRDDEGNDLKAWQIPPESDRAVRVATTGPDEDVELAASQVRELIRWLAAAIGEPNLTQADVFSFTDTAGQEQRIANRDLGDCPICGHPIHAGAYVTRIVDTVAGLDTWAHEHCEQFPPTVSKTAPDTETRVTHVEGQPQP